jgi:hypothetical protein
VVDESPRAFFDVRKALHVPARLFEPTDVHHASFSPTLVFPPPIPSVIPLN